MVRYSPVYFDPQSPAVKKVLADIRSKWKFIIHFFWKLPTLLWFGIRIQSIDTNTCAVTLPYSWRTQNPFRSIYFAAQAGAAELSTGLLILVVLAGRKDVSMLVTRLEVDYIKKADSRTTFTCRDGQAIIQTIDRLVETGQPQILQVTSEGIQATGEVVSKTRLTWSFKLRVSKIG